MTEWKCWTRRSDKRLLIWQFEKLLHSCYGSLMCRSNRGCNIPPPPGHTPGIWHFAVPRRREFDYQSSTGWGIWSPWVRGWEFELHPRFHVKSLAWRAVVDFRGNYCAFVANWVRGFCRIWRYLNFNIFNIGFRLWIYECIMLSL